MLRSWHQLIYVEYVCQLQGDGVYAAHNVKLQRNSAHLYRRGPPPVEILEVFQSITH